MGIASVCAISAVVDEQISGAPRDEEPHAKLRYSRHTADSTSQNSADCRGDDVVGNGGIGELPKATSSRS